MTALDEYENIRHLAMADLIADPRQVVYAADELIAELSGMCSGCRFWTGVDDYMRQCVVSGSFRTRGDLWTESDFGCVHFSRRAEP